MITLSRQLSCAYVYSIGNSINLGPSKSPFGGNGGERFHVSSPLRGVRSSFCASLMTREMAKSGPGSGERFRKGRPQVRARKRYRRVGGAARCVPWQPRGCHVPQVSCGVTLGRDRLRGCHDSNNPSCLESTVACVLVVKNKLILLLLATAFEYACTLLNCLMQIYTSIFVKFMLYGCKYLIPHAQTRQWCFD